MDSVDLETDLGHGRAVAGGEDATLVSAARNGDREAFGELYARYGRLVHGVLLARLPRQDVDDLVQDVFVTALHRLGTLRDPAAFGAWLVAIARNHATDHHRRGPEPARPAADEADPGKDPPPTIGLAVLNVIRSLPEAYRETLMLRLVEGMTGPEIASRTGLTHGSVRVNLHRGFKLLREVLGAERP